MGCAGGRENAILMQDQFTPLPVPVSIDLAPDALPEVLSVGGFHQLGLKEDVWSHTYSSNEAGLPCVVLRR